MFDRVLFMAATVKNQWPSTDMRNVLRKVKAPIGECLEPILDLCPIILASFRLIWLCAHLGPVR